jgi:HAE1 family hydrophobic/amphiphilic exporter-1
LKVNLLPYLSYPTLTIRTEYSGAAPAEIENLITKPIEEALGVVKNVQKVRSISRSGQSDVMLEFGWGTNMDYASLDVREKLDALILPLDVPRPVILRFDPSLDPIIRFGLARSEVDSVTVTTTAAGGFNEEELKFIRRFADEEVKKELESALGVAAVKVSGGLEDEIQVLVDQGRLAQLKIPIERISHILRSENVNLSGGRLEEGSHQFLVRTLNQFTSVSEIGNVIIDSQDGKIIYLKDIAVVRHGYKEREAIIRIDGEEAVDIAIYKEGDANTVAVAREVDRRLSRVRKMLPEDLSLVEIYNQSTFINQAVQEVVNAGAIGGLLAIIILYLFLRSIWATAIISISIPVSVIATFNLMYGADLTLNIMSLGGIALGIGMLLDNSIVVLENISRHRERGKEFLEAANAGAAEVSLAVVASTLTTVAVFFPLVFVKGIAGQLFRDQALTVTFALLVSLLVAITLIPMLASIGIRRKAVEEPVALDPPKTKLGRGLRRTRLLLLVSIPVFIVKIIRFIVGIISKSMGYLMRPLVKAFSWNYNILAKRYQPLLKWALTHRLAVIITALLMFAGSLALIPFLGVELIPQLSQGEFQVEFKLPSGTPLAETDATIARIQKLVGKREDVRTSFSIAGTGDRMDANPEEGGENWGELSIILPPGAGKVEEQAVIQHLRSGLERLPAVEYKFTQPTLFTFKTPVEVEIAGFDLVKLKDISRSIAQRLETSGRFADVKSTMESGHPEIRILFDREKTAALGLQVYEVADRVVNKVRGEVASRYSWHDRRIDILVRTREEDRNSVDQLRRLIVNPGSNHPVTLDAVADVVVETGPGEIRRAGQERIALVSANLNYGDLGAAAEELEGIIAETRIPVGFTARLSGQNEEMQVSFKSLQFALLLAIFLVYLIMASQFESLLHPFVIIFTIPLALIGAVLALFVTGATVSVVVFIGLIMLAGIVVNNAIVLVDLINQLRHKGKSKMEAILEGGDTRLRPILMTTFTTALGLLPLALGFGEGAEVRAPMAITVIGGLLMSTMLTLVVIPVVYSIVDRKE